MVKQLGATRIDLDEIKFAIFGKDIVDEDLNQKDWDQVYEKMYPEIEDVLKSGQSVIHDTGNFTKYERGLVRKIGEKTKARIFTIFIDTPYKVCKSRQEENKITNKRFKVSDESFESAVNEMELPGKDENPLVYKNGTSHSEWIKENFK